MAPFLWQTLHSIHQRVLSWIYQNHFIIWRYELVLVGILAFSISNLWKNHHLESKISWFADLKCHFSIKFCFAWGCFLRKWLSTFHPNTFVYLVDTYQCRAIFVHQLGFSNLHSAFCQFLYQKRPWTWSSFLSNTNNRGWWDA